MEQDRLALLSLRFSAYRRGVALGKLAVPAQGQRWRRVESDCVRSPSGPGLRSGECHDLPGAVLGWVSVSVDLTGQQEESLFVCLFVSKKQQMRAEHCKDQRPRELTSISCAFQLLCSTGHRAGHSPAGDFEGGME